jgi:hypothetical protein
MEYIHKRARVREREREREREQRNRKSAKNADRKYYCVKALLTSRESDNDNLITRLPIVGKSAESFNNLSGQAAT